MSFSPPEGRFIAAQENPIIIKENNLNLFIK